MQVVILGEDRFEKLELFLDKNKTKFRRVVAFTSVPLGARNEFDDIDVDILQQATDLCNKYPDKGIPFLFVFHGMDIQLKYNSKPIYADFFLKAQWVVTSITNDLPNFIMAKK